MAMEPKPTPIIASSPDDLASAERALRQRPRLSIRLRIAMGFMGTFVLICIVTIAAVIFLSRLGTKQLFIEKAGTYAFEIQQARRFEKNFLLYGTNLYDALDYINNAQEVLLGAREEFHIVIGNNAYQKMVTNFERYRSLLNDLEKLDIKADTRTEKQKEEFQNQLRSAGAEMVADAAGIVDKERERFHHWLHSAKLIAASALVLILIFESYIVTFFARQIFRPFKRFENYMRRISDGDLSPITPVKKFQDEFSDLAVAVNRMLKEIQDRGNQLVESRKMAAIGTLTAGIAHEINNPLNNISLTVEALLEDFSDVSDEEKKEMLSEVFTQVERAGATVANLLDFTQRDRSAFKPLDIKKVLDATLSLLHNELSLNNITLSMNTKDDLPAVNGHRQNLQQVFLNLFLNAKDAMAEGGQLTVCIERQKDGVRIDISDTGTGIPENQINRIFDPFFTTKEVGKGAGLGLSVSFGIIEKHHGSISVKSVQGQGSTFTIWLPAAMSES